MGTHLIVCKNEIALKQLYEDYVLLAKAAKTGKPVSQGDALVARDALLEAGLHWGEDFYIKKVDY